MANVYMYQAALLCEDCGKAQRQKLIAANAPAVMADDDSDSWPVGPYSDGGGEADCPQHCDHCQAFLENPLTLAGVRYVAEAAALKQNDSNSTMQLWKAFYASDLRDWDATAGLAKGRF